MKRRKIKQFIFRFYYSLLLCLVSLKLGITLIAVKHPITGAFFIAFVLMKFVGLVLDHKKIRVITITGLNVLWSISTYYFYSGYHPDVLLTYEFPLFVALLGVGIAIRGQFDEQKH